jgi:hypothetical protein
LKYTTVGLSLPLDIAQRIDTERGELGRSLFLRKIISKYYQQSAAGAGTPTK